MAGRNGDPLYPTAQGFGGIASSAWPGSCPAATLGRCLRAQRAVRARQRL